MRQVILDTETTGLDPAQGHRIIEIGCIELLDRTFTGRHYHVYLNPEREVDFAAFRVHGLSSEFLKDKPLFAEQVEDFLAFISDSALIIHNASFDLGFLNAELQRLNHKVLIDDRYTVIDTLLLARAKHPGQRNNLDALCKRYDIDNSNRAFHGALLDAQLLGLVYLAMTGGQSTFFSLLDESKTEAQSALDQHPTLSLKSPVVIHASSAELAQHQAFLDKLKGTA